MRRVAGRGSEYISSRAAILCGAITALCLAAPARAETVTYTLTPQPGTGRIEVEILWQTDRRSASRLNISSHWGSVADIPALLGNVAIDGTSNAHKNGGGWDLKHRPGAEIHCRYTVDPQRRELGWDGVHFPVAGAKFFHGIGTTFLITPAAGGSLPAQYEFIVRWKVPQDWQAVCSWGVGKTVGASLSPDDFRHAVFLAGPLVVKRVPVTGAKELTVALPKEFLSSAEDFSKLAAGIIGEQCAAMEDPDFPPFVVTAVPVAGKLAAGQLRVSGSGLYRSFCLFVPPAIKLAEGPALEEIEHLFAHELFHHWNGQLLHAEDATQGTVFWFTEGLTDYYALRILLESGRWNAATYAKWVNRHVRQYVSNPERNATNERIAAEYWKARDTVGEAPYQRGLLLGLRWHKLARQHGRSDGLDHLFKTLVQRARTSEIKLTNETIRKAGLEMLGDWFGSEFESYVVGAADVDVPRDALAPQLTGKVQAVYDFELGMNRAETIRQSRVVGLVAGSAAAKAGFKDGDELVGWDIPGDPEKKVVFQVLRKSDIKEISYFPRGKKMDVLQFTPAAGAKSGVPKAAQPPATKPARAQETDDNTELFFYHRDTKAQRGM